MHAWRMQDLAAAGTTSPLPSGRTGYRTYDDIQKELVDLAQGHPGIAREITLPVKTVEGRDIHGLEITKDVNAPNDGRPVFVYMSLHHAREWPTAEINMEFAHYLLENYGTSTTVTNILDHERVFLIPVVNVDGYINSRGNLSSSNPLFAEVYPSGGGDMRRKNCAADNAIEAMGDCTQRSGVDPNRNYGAFWGGDGADTDFDSETYRGTGPWSEPETQAIHQFTQHLQVNTLITMHNNAKLVLRPPGVESQGLAYDEPALKALGDRMGAATGYPSRYGWQLYDTNGTTEDWNYSAQGAFGYTIELGGGGFHPAYQGAVIDQWLGTGSEHGQGGVRKALLIAAQNAMDTTNHSVVEGDAPAGATLRLKKTFKTSTDPVCTVATSYTCVAPLDPIQVDDKLDTTMTVPASGHYVWDVNPSTRPVVAKAGGAKESWTLTCENAGGQVLETKTVQVDRGQRVTQNLSCGG